MRNYLLRRTGPALLSVILLVGSFVAAESSLAAPGFLRGKDANLIEPKAGAWKTWVMTSGNQFRLPAPPDKAATEAEIKQLKDMVAKRDAAAQDQIAFWDTGGPTYRWHAIAIDEILKNNPGSKPSYPRRGARGRRTV